MVTREIFMEMGLYEDTGDERIYFSRNRMAFSVISANEGVVRSTPGTMSAS